MRQLNINNRVKKWQERKQQQREREVMNNMEKSSKMMLEKAEKERIDREKFEEWKKSKVMKPKREYQPLLDRPPWVSDFSKMQME